MTTSMEDFEAWFNDRHKNADRDTGHYKIRQRNDYAIWQAATERAAAICESKSSSARRGADSITGRIERNYSTALRHAAATIRGTT
jgi:hypothetical protein